MKVLLVDDSKVIRMQLAQMFRDCDIPDTFEAENGQQALDMLSKDPFDLVTLDMHMPEMDGYECLSIMKSDERFREIPTIIVTSDTDKSLIRKFTDMGAGAFLRKPFHLDYFVMALTSACPFIEFVEAYEENPASEAV